MWVKHFLRQSELCFAGKSAAFDIEKFILLETIYPIISLGFYCYIAAYAYDTSDITEWVVGNAFLLCTNICIFSLGNAFSIERYSGRLRYIIAAPISKLEVVLEEGFLSGLVSFSTTFIGMIIACMVFKANVSVVYLLKNIPVLLCGIFSTSCFGVFISSIGLISDSMYLICNLVASLMLLFCGANFPVIQFGKLGVCISRCLPMTRAIKTSKILLEGKIVEFEVLKLLLGEFFLGILFIIFSVTMLKLSEKRAISKGTLEIF